MPCRWGSLRPEGHRHPQRKGQVTAPRPGRRDSGRRFLCARNTRRPTFPTREAPSREQRKPRSGLVLTRASFQRGLPRLLTLTKQKLQKLPTKTARLAYAGLTGRPSLRASGGTRTVEHRARPAPWAPEQGAESGPRPTTGQRPTPPPRWPACAQPSGSHQLPAPGKPRETVVTLELRSPDGEVACVGQSLSPGKLAVEMNFLTEFSLKNQ